MLIRFSVENWMSFKENMTFSSIARRERQHCKRVPKVGNLNLDVLPVAAIYGVSSSGKTNLFKALYFTKGLIIMGALPNSEIPVEAFRLGHSRKLEQPTHFEFELLIGETIYVFSFSLNRTVIIEEKLVHISDGSQKRLYHRKFGEPNFDSSLFSDKSLQSAFKDTPENQLFLTHSVFQKINLFKPVYDWFKDTLELVAPNSRFELFDQIFDQRHPLYETINKLLAKIDNGISHLGVEEVPFENLVLPQPMKMKLMKELPECAVVRLVGEGINDRIVVGRKNGELISKKLVTYHLNSDGSETKFDMRQESESVQRIIDLLPAFLELSIAQSTKVFVIDEIDRSLDALLAKRLIQAYLSTCSHDSRSQLLLTTHNLLLMDQKLFRRDEMWITERNEKGISNAVPFAEYKNVTSNKNFSKNSLQGWLSGIPRILLQSRALG